MKADQKWNVDWSEILPEAKSHKGENGKVLVIGGSRLFHAPLKWSLEILSKLVDMVFAASTQENNALLAQAKGEFWDGIVISREETESYIQEADAILIGPGMERKDDALLESKKVASWTEQKLSEADWENNTELIVNYLLAKYPSKKWVLDAGALQMVDPRLITSSCILTPHKKEWQSLGEKLKKSGQEAYLPGGIILKGMEDEIFWNSQLIAHVSGGNPGMTKGGTGDCLAGLVTGLSTKTDIQTAMILASEVCKQAGDEVYTRVGPFFNASDLAAQIPETFWNLRLEDA